MKATNQIMKWHSILLQLIVINQQINGHKKPHLLLIIDYFKLKLA